MIALKKKEEELEKGRIAEKKRLQEQKRVYKEKHQAEEKERKKRQKEDQEREERFQKEERKRQEIREREHKKNGKWIRSNIKSRDAINLCARKPKGRAGLLKKRNIDRKCSCRGVNGRKVKEKT